jgi:hypothetical protein
MNTRPNSFLGLRKDTEIDAALAILIGQAGTDSSPISQKWEDAVLQLPHLCPFVQALIAGRRRVPRNRISDSRTDKRGNDESMTAGRFGNKYNRGKRCFVSGSQE